MSETENTESLAQPIDVDVIDTILGDTILGVTNPGDTNLDIIVTNPGDTEVIDANLYNTVVISVNQDDPNPRPSIYLPLPSYIRESPDRPIKLTYIKGTNRYTKDCLKKLREYLFLKYLNFHEELQNAQNGVAESQFVIGFCLFDSRDINGQGFRRKAIYEGLIWMYKSTLSNHLNKQYAIEQYTHAINSFIYGFKYITGLFKNYHLNKPDIVLQNYYLTNFNELEEIVRLHTSTCICGEPALYRCGGCPDIPFGKYCCAECQRSHWPIHKLRCMR